MASAILSPTASSLRLSSLSSSSSTNRRHTIWGLSSSAISVSSQSSSFDFSIWLPQLGLCQTHQWTGLKRFGISSAQHLIKLERSGKRKRIGVYASLFGVGAPEVLVIGVVALLVFGPKGLAEVARNLGKTLRAFQPTIRELQDVSREFKSTLEREIGLDDIQTSTKSTLSSNPTKTTSSPSSDPSSEVSPTEIDPNGSASPGKPFSSEAFLKITEQQLRAAAAKEEGESKSPGENQPEIQNLAAEQQIETASSGESQSKIETQNQVISGSPQDAASAMPSPGKPERDT
ncbi:sec-independent protein translocase protein TATB, chloroplastic-like isoform X1 [Coffea arabica]|uniref:Sec-independent protein translocase protein TATB, chloroplastic-like isoform X1 n=1 Tax=Coffea arabica TaxID=13443 RepID=A0A6P6VP66_COFAR|nr:sec-independent protein translocase protein TATB, chloroplastic-like isoform X1 [Coffea arabica]